MSECPSVCPLGSARSLTQQWQSMRESLTAMGESGEDNADPELFRADALADTSFRGGAPPCPPHSHTDQPRPRTNLRPMTA